MAVKLNIQSLMKLVDQLTVEDRNLFEKQFLSNYYMYSWDGDEFDGRVIRCDNVENLAEVIYEDNPEFWPTAVAIEVRDKHRRSCHKDEFECIECDEYKIEDDIRKREDCREFVISHMNRMIKRNIITVLHIH